MRRRGLVLLGLAASAAVTAGLWLVGLPGLFLVLPFVFAFPLLLRGGAPGGRRCPACGWDSSDAEDRYCPRDGVALEGPPGL